MRPDDVLAVLAQHPTGLSDAEIAAQLGVVDEAIHGLCGSLAQQGVIIRDRTRTPMINIIAHDYQPPSRVAITRREWFAEPGVRSATVRHLSLAGAMIRTASDEITATVGDRLLHAIVTGYPSAVPEQRRPDDPPPASASNRARGRFADAMLTAVLMRNRWPDDRVVLAVPAMPRYTELRAGSAPVLDRIGVEVWLVAEDGSVATT